MDQTYCRFQLGAPDYVTIETEEQSYVSSGQKQLVEEGKTKVEFGAADDCEEIFLTSQEALRCVKLRWNYKIAKGSRFLTDAWERSYGELGWKGMSASRFMPWYFLAAGPEKTVCFGVKTRPDAMCYWQADTKGVTLFLDVRCGGMGVMLQGKTIRAAQVVCMETDPQNTFAAAQEFCRRMCPDPVLPEFPVYGSNNWYYAYGDSSQQEILSDTDYVLKLTQGASNRPFMVIDDCWQECHELNGYNGGPWKKSNEKFPDMKNLAQQLVKKGVRPGIWVRLLLNKDEEIREEWRIPHNGCLDPSHPDALSYIRRDVERICAWGYTLIKHDFSTYDLFGKWGFEANQLANMDGWHFYDRGMTSAQVVKRLYEEIYQVAKQHDTIVIGCNTIGHLGAGLMHLNRTADDTSGRLWERTRRMGINTLAFRLPQHGTFFHIDADCVGVMGPVPWEKNKQWADLLAKSGTPLFISVKPGILSPEQIEELHQMMLVASEQKQHFVPVDWQETDCPQVWAEDGNTVTYDWYEDAGPVLDSKVEQFFAATVVP